MIEKASLNNLDSLMVLYNACAREMNAAGFYNWNSDYPDRKTIESDIDEQTLYVLLKDNSIVAAITLNEEQPPEYRSINWNITDEPFLVVHRLAVNPDWQGKGLGKIMMDFTEKLAVKNRNNSIRMDVYTINKPARELYRKLNYTELDEFLFPGFTIPFIGLEKGVVSE